MEKTLKLKRHETFSIREGWIEKGINYMKMFPNCFAKDNGTEKFGLGSNMVKSLRYWVQACGLAKFRMGDAVLEPLGSLLFKYDPYLDDIFSFWLIHLNLVANENDDAPVFNAIFNLNYSKFDKTFLMNVLPNELVKNGYEEVGSMASLDSDISIFMKSYYTDEYPNPENNMNCPLAKLELFSYDTRRMFIRNNPSYKKLDYRIVYLALLKCLENVDDGISFNIEDIYDKHNSPLKLLNISKSALFNYLDEMQNNKYIRVNKTAGLNEAYIKKVKSLDEVVSSYFAKD